MIYGIDLGTTHSAIGLAESNKVHLFLNSLGNKLTPSVVAKDPKTNEWHVGETATEIITLNPDAGVANFKQSMGTNKTFSIDGKELNPIELSSFVLKSLKSDVKRETGQEVKDCVISVPAYFSERQRAATTKAAKIAGLNAVRIINEPTAAAIAYGISKNDDQSQFIILDLGGGTFDVCIMELFEGALMVQSTAGASMLGGEDFSEALFSKVIERGGLSLGTDPSYTSILMRRTEELKKQLSKKSTAKILVSKSIKDEKYVEMSREDFETSCAELIKRMEVPCLDALRSANVHFNDLDFVLLVGGATRMPMIKNLTSELFGQEPIEVLHPDFAVVNGAALQGQLISDNSEVGDFVVTDVLSHTLGVESSKEIAGQNESGFFSPIIHRNTVLPTTRTSRFHTVSQDQTKIDFKIYEGESRKVSENKLLGELEVKGIPKGKEKTVTVRFSYDLNGLLDVEAVIEDTGKKFQVVINRDESEMGKKEMEAALENLKKLKENSLTDPKYTNLIAHANSLYEQIGSSNKNVLDHYITALEEAISIQTPLKMETAYRELKKICTQIEEIFQR